MSRARWRCSQELRFAEERFVAAFHEERGPYLLLAFFVVGVMALSAIRALPVWLPAAFPPAVLVLGAVLAGRVRAEGVAARAHRRALRKARAPDAGFVRGTVRLEGVVTASERADGVAIPMARTPWPRRFTVAFAGGEAQVEPGPLCVAASSPIRVGDRVALLGPAVRANARRGGAYRARKLALAITGDMRRPLFVRKLPPPPPPPPLATALHRPRPRARPTEARGRARGAHPPP
ncbi:MAG: hypothetical protein AAGH15_24160 [Myxococcota bacterium]